MSDLSRKLHSNIELITVAFWGRTIPDENLNNAFDFGCSVMDELNNGTKLPETMVIEAIEWIAEAFKEYEFAM
jgi:hypothetical protein